MKKDFTYNKIFTKQELIKSTSLNVKLSAGFTLIELLVVIAIIGILSAVVLTATSSSKTKGRIGSVQQSMSTVRAASNICVASGTTLNTTPAAGAVVCTGDVGLWPTLPSGWSYATTASPSCHNGVDTLNTSGYNYKICAYSSADGKSVSCGELSCVTLNYTAL